MALSLTFRPPLWATLLLVVACALFVRAGFWQLDRKAEKASLFSEFDQGRDRSALTDLPVSADTARYRLIRLEGRFDTQRQVLLDNMARDGKVGYEVLTPLRTASGVVMVNRGWLAAGDDRNRLPAIDVDESPRQLEGLVDRLPRPGLRLAGAVPEADAPWPRRLLYPDADELARNLNVPVLDMQILLAANAADGFVRDWRPKVSDPDTHLAYAVQWFAFAITVIVIYLILNLKRKAPTAHE